MRFIKIDPFDGTVREHLTPVTLDREFMAKELRCQWIERVRLGEGNRVHIG